jgi:hypothetical protein
MLFEYWMQKHLKIEFEWDVALHQYLKLAHTFIRTSEVTRYGKGEVLLRIAKPIETNLSNREVYADTTNKG